MSQPDVRPDMQPERVRLRPGLRVLERGREQVQVGLDPARAVRLTCTPAVRRTLQVVTEGGHVADCDGEVLDRLRVLRVLHEPEPPREATRVVVRTEGSVPETVASTLADAGLDVLPDPAPGDVGLLVSVGEPRRDLVDDWTVLGLPHLVLRFTESAVVVGPYVVPGRTACLRCVDAHHTDLDPRWPLLVEQQARQRHRRDGVPDPVDPTLARLGATWAAHDLLTATGCGPVADLPATWSTILRFPQRLADFEATTWWRHPGCGCSTTGPAGTTGPEGVAPR